MPEGTNIVNLGELSKPANTLIKKVCNAVGIVFESTRIVRRAKGEAKAAKIKLLSDIELTEIRQRAFERIVQQEERNQRNIESITFQAAALLKDEAQPDKLDDDWLAYFFRHCEIVSDEQMQSLWARLLAGEAEQPGSYMKRTLDLVAKIDRYDADLFTRLCGFCWLIDGLLAPTIFDINHHIVKKHELWFGSLQHLETIGLIALTTSGTFARTSDKSRIEVSYFERRVALKFRVRKKLPTGRVMLTAAGAELARIAGAQGNPECYEYTMSRWRSPRLKVTPLVN